MVLAERVCTTIIINNSLYLFGALATLYNGLQKECHLIIRFKTHPIWTSKLWKIVCCSLSWKLGKWVTTGTYTCILGLLRKISSVTVFCIQYENIGSYFSVRVISRILEWGISEISGGNITLPGRKPLAPVG